MEILHSNITINDRWLGKPVIQHVKEFGYLIGAIFLLIGAAKLFYGATFSAAIIWLSIGFFLAVGGVVFPTVLKPLWYYWMKFALTLGVFMTFILISLAWFIMFVPMGLLFKLIGKKTVNLHFKTSTDSYWEVRPEKSNDFKLIERQF